MDNLTSYDFLLPEELIATSPLENRGTSRLLCLLKGEEKPRHDYFANINNYLKSGDVLVVNNTKVMKARLKAYKATGGACEILLVRPLPSGNWDILINGKGPFIAGMSLSLGCLEGPVLTIVKKNTGDAQGYEINCPIDFFDYAEKYGELPLPPYMRRKAEQKDEESYQTVYAKELGAVAAPTAGLHFSDHHLLELKALGVEIAEITLHVGPGTFLPIRTDNIAEHIMHREHFFMSAECASQLNKARLENRRIIAVGSTAMRTLEQVMLWAHEKNSSNFFACLGETSLFIRPGFEFKACNALITNFHVPRSTLLVLVSAVAGRERILNAYQEAVSQQYRFFSYGDACFMEIIQ